MVGLLRNDSKMKVSQLISILEVRISSVENVLKVCSWLTYHSPPYLQRISFKILETAGSTELYLYYIFFLYVHTYDKVQFIN